MKKTWINRVLAGKSKIEHRRKGKTRDKHQTKEHQVVDCVMSLASAVQQAGGGISPDIIDVTLGDFITNTAAQNRIRFICLPEGFESTKDVLTVIEDTREHLEEMRELERDDSLDDLLRIL